MNALLKLDAHFFLKNGGGEIGHPATEEVGDQADQQIAHRQWAERQAKRGQAAGNAEINKQFPRVDMREQAFME
ncbi:Uncharacterised protein [Enterobacter cloacae]|uniref:Uncharacterized protein n=1 Tax=Enterobacter cloacae TaxID=550 RepID=A0A377LU50_ENTCL|nr:Uncharacterised protein [Enterobacter cloacae]